ncbi:MAG: UbiD family decarboxylase [Myxococcales bacterium]|nr:UbiD family decarboxylase [Myxococcales bacterium]
MRDLRAFLNVLRDEGELVEVDTEVDPYLELAEVHRRVIAANGPAVLFKRPKGSAFPVVTNLFGTKRRVDLAFGKRANEFVRRVAALPHALMPPSPSALWAQRDLAWQGLSLGLSRSGSGPVTEVVSRPGDLTNIPMLTCWKEDGGAFVTLPLVYTEHPENRSHNLGMYRIQRHGPALTGVHWQIGKGGGFHHGIAETAGQALPVNLLIGGPPGLICSAIAPLPENVPELLLASLLVGERLRTCDNPAGPLQLVADAEFAIVGKVPPNRRHPEGPFGDHYGYYSLRHDYPVIEVEAICHRKDAIWPATVVGKPRQEDFYIGDFLQQLLSPLFPLVMPTVRDLWSYGETGYHSLSAAVVRDRYHREAMASAFRILGEGQLSLTKCLLLVDEPLDLRDFKQVLEHLLARFRPETDLYVFSNTSMDTLDYAGFQKGEVNKGSKAVMLGIGPAVRELPRVFKAPASGDPPGAPGSRFHDFAHAIRDVRVYCPGCLVVEVLPFADAPELAGEIADAFDGWPLVVLVDNAKQATSSDPRFLWTAFTRMEPAADLHGTRSIVKNHLAFSGPVVLDARMKPWYPDELFCDPDTAATVSRRWAEYFPAGTSKRNVEMGDSDVGHLDG